MRVDSRLVWAAIHRNMYIIRNLHRCLHRETIYYHNSPDDNGYSLFPRIGPGLATASACVGHWPVQGSASTRASSIGSTSVVPSESNGKEVSLSLFSLSLSRG